MFIKDKNRRLDKAGVGGCGTRGDWRFEVDLHPGMYKMIPISFVHICLIGTGTPRSPLHSPAAETHSSQPDLSVDACYIYKDRWVVSLW